MTAHTACTTHSRAGRWNRERGERQDHGNRRLRRPARRAGRQRRPRPVPRPHNTARPRRSGRDARRRHPDPEPTRGPSSPSRCSPCSPSVCSPDQHQLPAGDPRRLPAGHAAVGSRVQQRGVCQGDDRGQPAPPAAERARPAEQCGSPNQHEHDAPKTQGGRDLDRAGVSARRPKTLIHLVKIMKPAGPGMCTEGRHVLSTAAQGPALAVGRSAGFTGLPCLQPTAVLMHACFVVPIVFWQVWPVACQRRQYEPNCFTARTWPRRRRSSSTGTTPRVGDSLSLCACRDLDVL